MESLAGEESHENFVSFQFKGGAADRKRRQLRARMVADLLEHHGFRADAKDDSVFAVAEGYDAIRNPDAPPPAWLAVPLYPPRRVEMRAT